jgi:hypothetical protein
MLSNINCYIAAQLKTHMYFTYKQSQKLIGDNQHYQ